MNNMYNEKKAAEVAAFFLFRAHGKMPILKLMKLMYLAERTSYKRYGEPIIGDKLVSMPHGPVLSITYQHVNGELSSIEGGWETWVGDRSRYDVELQDPSSLRSTDDLLELSDADAEILDEIWTQFGHLTKWQIRDFTHIHCPEWRDPNGSMIPMDYEDLFRALEFNDEQVRELAERLYATSGLRVPYSTDPDHGCADVKYG